MITVNGLLLLLLLFWSTYTFDTSLEHVCVFTCEWENPPHPTTHPIMALETCRHTGAGFSPHLVCYNPANQKSLQIGFFMVKTKQ